MSLALRRARPRGGWRDIATSLVVIALTAIPLAAAGPASPDDERSFPSEWAKVRQNYERAIRESQKRIAEIEARGGAGLASPERRAEKITQDAVAGAKASLTGRGQGRRLDTAGGEWGKEGGKGKPLHDASTALQHTLELIDSHLTRASAAAAAMSSHVERSGVLERVTRTEAAAKEAGERLSARWERERAAREREREQRAREAGQRTRGRL